MKNKIIFILTVLLILPVNINAVDIPLVFEKPEQEARYKLLVEDLRCLVCQNQSVADSNADLAQDFRNEIYNRILQGQTDSEIIEFLVSRYGDFVLYQPPFKARTLVLWLGPFALLIIGILIAVYINRRRQKILTNQLSSEEEQKLAEILQQSKGE